MTGVSYMVDEAGRKMAVILDLRRHRKLWEDIYDRMLIDTRRHESRETLDQVRKRLRRPHSTANA